MPSTTAVNSPRSRSRASRSRALRNATDQLVAGQLHDPDAVRIGARPSARPQAEQDRRGLFGQADRAPARRAPAPAPAVVGRRQRVGTARLRSRRVADRRQQRQLRPVGAAEPQRPAVDPGQPDDLERRRTSPGSRASRPRRRAGSAGTARTARPLRAGRHRRPGDSRARAPRSGPGGRLARSSAPQGATAGAGTRRRPGRGDRRTARRAAGRGRAGRRGPGSSACRRARPRMPPRTQPGPSRPPRSRGRRRPPPGASVSRIVLSPGWHRPRRASPAAAARNIAASAGPSSTSDRAGHEPASMQAVPYSGPDAPPTAATSR